MADPELLPAPTVIKAQAAAPVCDATGCGGTPLAQWVRRLTADEYAAELALVQARWDAAFQLRDVQLPNPVQPPMPSPDTFTRAVYACGPHAIGIDEAAQIHEADCSVPHSVPYHEACDCTPEAPESRPEHVALMPDHWATAMTAGG